MEGWFLKIQECLDSWYTDLYVGIVWMKERKREREELETCANGQAKKEKERETDTRGNEN